MASREVEVDAEPAWPDAAAFVAHLLGVARGDVARHEVAEARVLALQVVVALGFGNLAGRARVALLQRHPDAAVVAQRLAHQRELGLVVAADRDAGRVDLREARVGEQRAALVRPPDGGGVAALGVGREVEDVAVAAGASTTASATCGFDLAGDQVARDDAARLAVDTTRSSISCAGTSSPVPWPICRSSAW